MMIICSVVNLDIVKDYKTKLAVRIFFSRRNYHVFYISLRQFNKLLNDFTKTFEKKRMVKKLLCVIDGSRYVWSGIEDETYSDRPFLEKHFGAKSCDNFKVSTEIEYHNPDIIEPVNLPPDETLTR